MAISTKSCRNCLGGGCVHCNHRGEVRQRTFSRQEIANAKLRQNVFGSHKFNKAFVDYGQAAH